MEINIPSVRLIAIYHHQFFFSFITIPWEIQYSCNTSSFTSRRSRLVAIITVSSINIKECNHPRKPSSPQRSFNIRMRVLTYIVKRKQEVGDSCLTPTVAVTAATPRILLVSLYIATNANNIAAPQPSLLSVFNSLFRGTLSYALLKSTNTTNNLTFLITQ